MLYKCRKELRIQTEGGGGPKTHLLRVSGVKAISHTWQRQSAVNTAKGNRNGGAAHAENLFFGCKCQKDRSNEGQAKKNGKDNHKTEQWTPSVSMLIRLCHIIDVPMPVAHSDRQCKAWRGSFAGIRAAITKMGRSGARRTVGGT